MSEEVKTQAEKYAWWDSPKGKALRKAQDNLRVAQAGYNLAAEVLEQAQEDFETAKVEVDAARIQLEALESLYGDEAPTWNPDLGNGIGAYE